MKHYQHIINNIVNFSFKKIENIISIDEVEDFKESIIKNGGYNVLSQDTKNWNRFYNKGEHYDIFGNKLTKKIEEITGINDLVFAYGFGAKYKLNGKLDPHYDNWNNTISMTVCLENLNKEWPIYVHKQKYNNPYSWRQTIYNIEKLNKNDIAEIKLKPGDGAIFSGSNHLHWRDNMENETSIVLLHWTKKNTKYFENERTEADGLYQDYETFLNSNCYVNNLQTIKNNIFYKS